MHQIKKLSELEPSESPVKAPPTPSTKSSEDGGGAGGGYSPPKGATGAPTSSGLTPEKMDVSVAMAAAPQQEKSTQEKTAAM